MSFAGQRPSAGTSQGNCTAMRKTASAKIQYQILNQGTPREHVVFKTQFKRSGNYQIFTDNLQAIAGPQISSEDQKSLNIGLTRAVEGLTRAAGMLGQMPVRYVPPSSWI